MLRLCHGLPRYSVDLDFWAVKAGGVARLYEGLGRVFRGRYEVRDSANKRFTLLYELRKAGTPRALKVEVRKDAGKYRTEAAIAFSAHWPRQVLVNAVVLPDMMKRKVEAFLDRKEIRDAFDMEYMLRRGVPPAVDPGTAKELLKEIGRLRPVDYKVKLGSLLEPSLRRHYTASGFKLLAETLREVVSRG
jgi:hypothetical protein